MTSVRTSAPDDRPGLRERKKTRTRQAIRREAYRLFTERGYEATTVEQICAAAEVSPSTFFRYFPAKEDVVLTDEYDLLMKAALRARPADEPLVDSVRAVVRDRLGEYVTRFEEEVRARARLFREVPSLRDRMAGGMEESRRELREIMAERTGLPADCLEVRVVCGALVTALAEGFVSWGEESTPEELLSDVDHALDVLSRGLGGH